MTNQAIESDYLLLQALRRVLRPLVRLLILKNVPLQVLNDLLKELYVNVAEDQLNGAKAKATHSQISLMTGVHRRDVRRYRDKTPDTGRDVPHVSVGAEIVAIWTGSPHFLSADGLPLPLPYANKTTPSFSFSSLAESVSTDVRPRAMLDELLRQNIVRYNDVTDQVWLNTEAFVPQEGWAKKLYYFGRNLEDHLSSSVANIISDKPPYLDRSLYYSGLTKESAEELQALARETATKALRAVNRRALELSESDKDKDSALSRINFGTYFYSDADTGREQE